MEVRKTSRSASKTLSIREAFPLVAMLAYPRASKIMATNLVVGRCLC